MRVLRIEPERCTGCLRCELACSVAQTGELDPARSVIRVGSFERHTSFAPYTCFQCAEGWCMTACPVEAIGISAVGAKEIHGDRCVGCKLCILACPYGTVFYDHAREQATKCDLCAGDPACAKACPTQAITWAEGPAQDWLGAFAAERSARELGAEGSAGA